VQFEKNTVPDPFSPLIHGSSKLWVEYNAIFTLSLDLQNPNLVIISVNTTFMRT